MDAVFRKVPRISVLAEEMTHSEEQLRFEELVILQSLTGLVCKA
jgi:hypothetical protein